MNRIIVALVAVFLVLFYGTVSAADYPSKRITIVAPIAPGGSTDLFLRMLADKLKDRVGQQVLVENRPGAAALVGTEYVARAEPDGYTLLGIYGQGFIPELVKDLHVNMLRDFEPVSIFMESGLTLLVSGTVPVTSFQELVAYGKANPGKLNYGSPAAVVSVITEAVGNRFGVKLFQVNYKGAAPISTALLTGEIHLVMDSSLPYKTYFEGNRVRPLVSTGRKRNPLTPNVPTLVELGYPEFDIATAQAIWAPARTPKEIVQYLNKEIVVISRLPDIVERVRNVFGQDIVASTPEQMRERLERDWAFLRQAARTAKYEPQ